MDVINLLFGHVLQDHVERKYFKEMFGIADEKKKKRGNSASNVIIFGMNSAYK